MESILKMDYDQTNEDFYPTGLLRTRQTLNDFEEDILFIDIDWTTNDFDLVTL